MSQSGAQPERIEIAVGGTSCVGKELEGSQAPEVRGKMLVIDVAVVELEARDLCPLWE